jgi:hypothetical protein
MRFDPGIIKKIQFTSRRTSLKFQKVPFDPGITEKNDLFQKYLPTFY